jgi:hypothetical protein
MQREVAGGRWGDVVRDDVEVVVVVVDVVVDGERRAGAPP